MRLWALPVLVFAASLAVSTCLVPSSLPLTRIGKHQQRRNSRLQQQTTAKDNIDTSSAAKQDTALSFDKFDYSSCWYPVVWACDLPLDRPTRVTVFDTDYVVARIMTKNKEEEEIICMLDRCPHKSASLSEGRVTSSGYFQCAYHGWSFDGKDGTCVEIPQTLTNEMISKEQQQSISSRACGTAVPAMIVQGMVWIFPGGNLEEALLAPPPPVIEEMDKEGYKTVQEIRDFPIDWTILLENIMDPDHGLFAHQAEPFDLYCASQDRPQSLHEQLTHNGKRWIVTSRVDAVRKMTALDKSHRRDDNKKSKEMAAVPSEEDVLTATTTFTAPNHVVMARRDKGSGQTKFLTAFWVCPVGTGRSRFMAVAIAKVPFLPPRWFMHINVNNFLDQDSHLLATQQSYVLGEEAKIVRKYKDKNMNLEKESTNLRKNLFVYQSPTEKLGVRIGALWDATLNRVPNRVATLLDMDRRGSFRSQPSRELVLDRRVQHTQICPDSQDVVHNCNRVQTIAKRVTILIVAAKAWSLVATIKTAAATTASASAKWATRLDGLLKPSVLGWTLGLCAVSSWLAKKIHREFFFKYTEELRNRDMDNLPKHWADRT